VASQVLSLDWAIEHYTGEIAAKPTSSTAWSQRGLVWHELRKYDKAIADFSEAIRLDPRSAHLTSRGTTWLAKKEYDKATTDLSEAIRLDPKSGRAYCHRGAAWLDVKEHNKAIADFSEAIRFDAGDASVILDNVIKKIHSCTTMEFFNSGSRPLP
jgi:tetratricopeptide (TPR) repeat protein